ncbi:hypothetical protein [Methylocystis parvus]|jgi:hypothetical protein|uniref:hypothetical protein n=1 Tax=Methylocystis parvus TaxID=134 RepID=UPI003C7341A7
MAFNRPPLSSGCNSQPGQGTPTAISDADACAYLPQLRAAYYALLAGSQTQRVRYGEQEISYSRGNVELLRAEVRRLETLCGAGGGTARAIRAGGYRPYPYPGRRFGWPY